MRRAAILRRKSSEGGKEMEAIDPRVIGSYVIQVIFWGNILLGTVLVFAEHRNPSSTWAWLLVLYFIPLLGFILYLFFGQDLRKRHLFRAKQQEDQKEIARYQAENIDAGVLVSERIRKRYNDMVRMLLESSNAVITDRNEVDLFTDGNDKFAALMADLEQAKDYIWMQYYIFHNDDLGNRIMDILVRKAEEGVDVRLITDGMGSRHEPPRFFRRLKNAGGHVVVFYKPYFPLISVRINFRNHRKNVVIDGKIGYVGGFNVGDEYLGKGRLGYWRDTHLRVQGSAVGELAMRFVLDWNHASPDKLDSTDFYHRDRSGDKVIPCVHRDGKLHAHHSDVIMQIVSSGPDSEYQNIRNGYLKMINEAEHHVFIESPYLVLDEAVMETLKVAALSGIDVRIIIPQKPDHLGIDGANMSFVGELLPAGVRIFRYRDGFIHSKTILADDQLAAIGTANMDVRSFRLDFEVSAFIYDSGINAEMTRDFIRDQGASEEITLEDYQKRSLWMRFKQSLMRLISPLL